VALACALLAAGCVLSAHAGRAHAAESADEAAMRRGLELREKGNDDAALGEFQRAYELRQTGRARAQMALAEQALGRWIDAEAHLAEALQRNREPWISRNASLLEQALADIREHLGSMELSGGQPGAEVRVNGRVVGRLPLDGPVRVEAGSVAVEVRAPGYLPIARTLVVPAKGLARQPIVMVAVTVMPEAPPERALPHPITNSPEGGGGDAPPRTKQGGGWGAKKVAGVVVGIVGVGALGGGVGFHLLRETRASKFNQDCTLTDGKPTPTGTATDCSARYDGITQARNLAIAGYVSGPILLGISAYLLLSSDGSRGDAATSPRYRLACAPTGGLGVSCGGRF